MDQDNMQLANEQQAQWALHTHTLHTLIIQEEVSKSFLGEGHNVEFGLK